MEEVSADGTKAIYTLSGQLLLTTNDLPAAIGTLTPGVYILRANGNTRKIVVR
ncbi:MAG: T9SS type A sorting domain-containing protein [Paludibacteraceae bacterium]